jgi:hypothetical protein
MSSFIMEIYDAETGAYVGPGWNSSHFGGAMPDVGDTIFAPLSERDMGPPRDPDKFYAWKITHRYFIPSLEGGPCHVKALATQREPSSIERNLIWSKLDF